MDYYTVWTGPIPEDDSMGFDRAWFSHFKKETQYVRRIIGNEEREMFPEGYVLVTKIDDGLRTRQGMTPIGEVVKIQ